MTFPELWSSLDQTRIAAEVYSPDMNDVDLAEARDCVYQACAAWLERDLATFVITGVEEAYQDDKFKCVFDLRGQLKLEQTHKSFKPYGGERFIIDWKTTNSPLDARWAERLLASWQWRLYAMLPPTPILFMYRGIRRPSNLEEQSKIWLREQILEVPSGNAEESAEFLRLMHAKRDFLVNGGELVWPRNMPTACFAYNRTCPFFEDCNHYTMPRKQLIETGPLSYSSIMLLQGCEEKFRRLRLLRQEGAEDGEETDSTRFGSAVHRGLAEVYRQAFKLKDTTTTK